jgi:hypothetical protein
MRHIDRGDAEVALHVSDLLAQRDADLDVQRGERLVEQQDLRLNGERASQRHALLLAAGELVGIAGSCRFARHKIIESNGRRARRSGREDGPERRLTIRY